MTHLATQFPVFSQQFIAGQWRDGRDGSVLQVTNPFDGSELAQIVQADRDDLDEAYRKAAQAQVQWAATGLPSGQR